MDDQQGNCGRRMVCRINLQTFLLLDILNIIQRISTLVQGGIVDNVRRINIERETIMNFHKVNTAITMCFVILLFAGCASSPYIPQSLEGSPESQLVQVILSNYGSAKLISIDKMTISSFTPKIFYISPGLHTFTFDMSYVSRNYYPGYLVLPGIPPDAKMQGKSLLIGEYSMPVEAKAGESVQFIRRVEPDLKQSINDYFNIVVSKRTLSVKP
jgi:hypothetical protein